MCRPIHSWTNTFIKQGCKPRVNQIISCAHNNSVDQKKPKEQIFLGNEKHELKQKLLLKDKN